MGKIISTIKNPFRNFNLESRAHEIISKDKPVPAPKHKPDLEKYEQILKQHPENFAKKHEDFDERLRRVYINSRDPEVRRLQLNIDPGRPLPVDRNAVEDYEFGFREPSRVSPGKVTLRKALRFISEHQCDEKRWNAARIAEDYRLSEKSVGDILKYFQLFEIFFPDKMNKATFAGPIMPKVVARNQKQIASGDVIN